MLDLAAARLHGSFLGLRTVGETEKGEDPTRRKEPEKVSVAAIGQTDKVSALAPKTYSDEGRRKSTTRNTEKCKAEDLKSLLGPFSLLY